MTGNTLNIFDKYSLQSKLALTEHRLFDTHKLSVGRDYAYVLKAEKVHVLCSEEHVNLVNTAFDEYAIKIDSMTTYKD